MTPPHLTPPVGPEDHIQGVLEAPLTLVEYGDYECPHCRAAYPVVNAVQRRLVGVLRFVYRHFPLSQVHPHAEHAAEAAEAAGAKGKFWEMHDLLFRNQHALEDAHLVAYGVSVGVEAAWMVQALRSGLFYQRVRRDFVSGARSGVNGTPTFFINGIRYDGPWDEPLLLAALEYARYAERIPASTAKRT